MADVYIDFGANTGVLTGTWTFTNGSASVTAASNGDAVNELDVGDYVMQSDGIQWYKVTATPDADTITISPVFQQATHTDDIGASKYNDTSVSGALNTDYVHHNQATTDTVRTAGDIIRTRTGTYTYAGVDITFDEDGTIASRIEVRGIYTAAGDDSWSDGDTTRPVIDFASTSNQMLLANDDFWSITGHDVKESHDSNGAITISASDSVLIDDCRIYDNGNATTHEGILVINSPDCLISNTVLDNNFGYNIHVSSCNLMLDSCTLTGDDTPGVSGNSTDYGVFNTSGLVYLKNCTLGVGDAAAEHDTSDVGMNKGYMYGRNCIFDSTTEVTFLAPQLGMVLIEDNEQTHEAFKGWFYTGTIERDGGETPPGGSGWAMRGDENSNTGANRALYITGDELRGLPVYLDGTAQTITVKIKCLDADWTDGGGTGGRPDNSELFIELDYNDGATSWATVQSTEACVDDTYTPFTVTVTPNAAGPAYLKVLLLLYDVTGGGAPVFVDPIPTFS